MAKKTLRDLDVSGRRVFVRADFNVPLKDTGEGSAITDDTRIRGAVPTLRHLLDAGASVVVTSHLGRPKGERDEAFSLRPVAARLGELLGTEVAFAGDCVGEVAESAAAALEPGEVLLLENLRFHAGETKNDPGFAARLAKLADLYVNDAFGTAHRAHASTAGIVGSMEDSAMGLLMERELEYLEGKLRDPERPFVVIMGGAKVSDKIEVIKALMEKADSFLIGGAMAYTFRKAQGCAVGDSLVEDDKLDLALRLLDHAETKGIDFLLPADALQTQEFKEGAETRNSVPYAPGEGIEDGWEGIDIGERAIADFTAAIAGAKTIVWNGPMGVFEIDSFARGTRAVAEAVAASGAVSIIGGGDSVTAVNKFGVADKMTFISTGGGASLELLEGKPLPGVAALADR